MFYTLEGVIVVKEEIIRITWDRRVEWYVS